MLRMTKQADYGIVLLSCMAAAPERKTTAPELSQQTQLPLPTVSKILKVLNRGDLLQSHRGAKGGYSLAMAPEDISVAAMIQVLDGPIALTECSDDVPGACSQEATCQIRGNWQLINCAVRDALNQISLAELSAPFAPQLVQLTVQKSVNPASP